MVINKWICKFILDEKNLVIIAFIVICWFSFLKYCAYLIRLYVICTASMWIIAIPMKFVTVRVYGKWMNEQNEQNSFSQE
jgi:hypothetical protein